MRYLKPVPISANSLVGYRLKLLVWYQNEIIAIAAYHGQRTLLLTTQLFQEHLAKTIGFCFFQFIWFRISRGSDPKVLVCFIGMAFRLRAI